MLPGSTTSSMKPAGCRPSRPAPPQPNPPNFAALVLDALHNQDLLHGPPAPRALLQRPDERLVDFDPAGQAFAARPNHRAPWVVQPRLRGLVAAQPQEPLQGERAGPRLGPGDGPHRPKPDGQRRARVLEDRAGRDRGLPPASRTVPQAPGQAFVCPHCGQRKPSGQRGRSSQARPGVLRRERDLEFGLISWVVRQAGRHYLLWSPSQVNYL